MAFEDVLDELDEMLEEAWRLPMTGGKCVLKGEVVKEKLEKLRLEFPSEIKRAKAVLSERERILNKAKVESEEIVSRAKATRETLLNEQDIVKEANAKAKEMLRAATEESAQLRKAAVDFVGGNLTRAEQLIESSLTAIKTAKSSIGRKMPNDEH